MRRGCPAAAAAAGRGGESRLRRSGIAAAAGGAAPTLGTATAMRAGAAAGPAVPPVKVLERPGCKWRLAAAWAAAAPAGNLGGSAEEWAVRWRE